MSMLPYATFAVVRINYSTLKNIYFLKSYEWTEIDLVIKEREFKVLSVFCTVSVLFIPY